MASELIAELLATILRLPNSGGYKLGPEDKLSAELFRWMRQALRQDAYRGWFLHIANEYTNVAGNELQSRIRSNKARAMGMVAGAVDWLFIWPVGNLFDVGWIELKHKGRLSPNQEIFRKWVLTFSPHHAVARDMPTITATLERWGALRMLPSSVIVPERRPPLTGAKRRARLLELEA